MATVLAHAALSTRAVVPSRRSSRQPLVVCKKGERTGGIHDPVGVGQGEKTAAKLAISQEEQRRLMQQRLQQQQSAPVGAGTSMGSLKATAERELLGLELEKVQQAATRPKSLQSMEADEEYNRMHPLKKWWYEALAAVFNWEKDGGVGGL